jgi:hypothetical protein
MTFSIQEDYLGSLRTINLVPNGQNEAVTNENKLEYIMYYADYLLNKKVRVQIQAFVEGLQMVIKKENLSIFFSDEIQLLISGGID